MRRVVITGMGLISPIGNDPESAFAALSAGKSAVSKVAALDEARYAGKPLPTSLGAVVTDLDPTGFVEPKDAKRMDPFILHALVASGQAWKQCGLPEKLDNDEGERGGTLVGVGLAGVGHIFSAWDTLKEKGARRISPLFIPSVIGNLAPGHIGMKYNLRGPNWTPASAGSSGAQSIGEGFRHIAEGRNDLMVVGGAESVVTPMVVTGYHKLGSYAHKRADTPGQAVRPFDAERDGCVIGEGAGIMVLEELERAKARGATIIAEVAGYGTGRDDGVPNHPAGPGLARALQRALEVAEASPEDVDYVNGHGSGVVASDEAECSAYRDVFGAHAAKLRVASYKGAIGDLLGGAGAVEGVLTAMSVSRSEIPPTTNLDSPDEKLGELDFVRGAPRKGDLGLALCASFGFGGENVVIAYKRYQG